MVLHSWTFSAFAVAFISSAILTCATPTCRYLPGDADWPSTDDWNTLNSSVSGRLIAVVPLGHVCHDPTYNAAACAALKDSWIYPQSQFVDPSGFMSAYHQNASCNPYTARDTKCLQGNYVQYAIKVTGAGDVQAGLKFAQEKNVRLVIKNTGHDYLGKSTGKGALSLWMHDLKSISFSDFKSDTYDGTAVKMGAGVQGFEAYAAADKAGVKIMGGQCLTVGIVGGYAQGGGHSLLTSKNGMGADQALEWEVVTANGTLVTATPTENSDLYWALSGGGGGTYGVVLSLTYKTYPDGTVGGVSLEFAGASADDDALWNAVTYFQKESLPIIVDAGAHVTWVVTGSVFIIEEATIPGFTEDEMRSVFSSFTTYLDGHGLQYQMNVTSYPKFYQHIDKYVGPLPYGTIPAAQIQGGAMISRSYAVSNTASLTSILRNIAITYPQFKIAAYSMNASTLPASSNAVLPAWRETLSNFVILQYWNFTVPVEVMDKQESLLTDKVMPPLQDVAIGAYMNEADFNNPRWKEEFYGDNWDRLLEVKNKWDPQGELWATTAVGSDDWVLEGDGRLCRAV